MTRSRATVLWLLVRVIFYVAVVVILFNLRGNENGRSMLSWLPGLGRADTTLALGGRDLAPALIDLLVAKYRSDYPDLQIQVDGGGTNQALEALLNRKVDVAFLSRAPSLEEQNLFRSMDGDSALFYPIAVGGIVLLANEQAEIADVTLEELRTIVGGGGPGTGFDRVYAPDPNLGLWVALGNRLGTDVEGHPQAVVFLQDEGAVTEAVRRDVHALGLVSSLALPGDLDPPGVRTIPIRSAGRGGLAQASLEDIGSGVYPLFHYLYVACSGDGDIQGAMFVTHVTSGRGQRQVERAGFLPARQVLREVHLTTHPVGE